MVIKQVRLGKTGLIQDEVFRNAKAGFPNFEKKLISKM